MKEALFYKKMNNSEVKCLLCPHFCVLKNGQSGLCSTRKNIDGKLIVLNYNSITVMHMDPIEKKPLYHFKPGSLILSIGSYGCNFRCGYCQNHTISFGNLHDTIKTTPKHIAQRALDLDINIGVAYTYNEPTVFYEMMRDTAIEVNKLGMDNILVSNGYINERPLRELIPNIQGANIDLKAFNQHFYEKITRGNLKDVLRTIEVLHSEGVHLEITHLLIQGFNDNINDFKEMINWISKVSPEIPLHVSRYYPAYKFTTRATNPHLIKHYADVAKEKLKYVYMGNVAYVDINTYCPECGHVIIRRTPFLQINLKGNKCEKCGHEIHIVL